MALAEANDVAKALQRDLTSDETASLASGDLLDEASDLVIGYLYPSPVPTPTPAAITRVVAAMAAAVLNRPSSILPNTQALTAQPFGATFEPGAYSPGPYLTAGFKQRLSPFRLGNGMTAIELCSELYREDGRPSWCDEEGS